MICEPIAYRGWKKCLRLANDVAELIIVLDVGPRIISYALKGGKNVFKTYEEMMGVTSGSEWMIFGGHRLWHAPESFPRTYALDFEPVDYVWSNGVLTLRPPEEMGTGLRKEIELILDPHSAQVRVVHRLFNHGLWDIELAPWCLTVMAPGARAIVPQEPFGAHPDYLKPARPLVLWQFTDMADPRWTWGTRYIQLQQDPARVGPQKVGLFNSHGWAACAVNDSLFVIKYEVHPGKPHADFGSNTEVFTNGDMLEMETLGPLSRVVSGASVEHVEQWGLFDQTVGSSEEEITRDVLPCVEKVQNV